MGWTTTRQRKTIPSKTINDGQKLQPDCGGKASALGRALRLVQTLELPQSGSIFKPQPAEVGGTNPPPLPCQRCSPGSTSR